jgi:hypothetical protein
VVRSEGFWIHSVHDQWHAYLVLNQKMPRKLFL